VRLYSYSTLFCISSLNFTAYTPRKQKITSCKVVSDRHPARLTPCLLSETLIHNIASQTLYSKLFTPIINQSPLQSVLNAILYPASSTSSSLMSVYSSQRRSGSVLIRRPMSSLSVCKRKAVSISSRINAFVCPTASCVRLRMLIKSNSFSALRKLTASSYAARKGVHGFCNAEAASTLLRLIDDGVLRTYGVLFECLLLAHSLLAVHLP
jgi:hypothetical protein